MINSFVFNPQQQYLFRRAYSLAIGPPHQTGALQYANFPLVGVDNQQQKSSPLKIKFDINKNSVGSSNKSKIEIYNLSQESRNKINVGWVVRLQAGYNGLIDTIFFGSVAPNGMKSERKEADIITTLECGDGESAIVMSRLDRAYPAGTTLAAILTDVAIAMNTVTAANTQQVNFGIALGIPNIVMSRGFTATGACRDTLDKLLLPNGMRWSVQNGNLNIIPVNATNGQAAVLISSDTGMIGTPSKNQGYFEFTSLLNPKLVPGAVIQIQSENTSLNGFYKIVEAHYEGDSHDTKWQVVCKCINQPGVGIVLRAANGDNYSQAVS